jgi:hypothetical protein
MISRSGDNPPDPTHAMFMAGVTSSRHDSGKRIVNHPCPAEGRGREVAELTCGCRREMIRRFGDRRNPREGHGTTAAVAVRASRRDADMVHCGPAECCRRFVAGLAGGASREVVRRFGHDPAHP